MVLKNIQMETALEKLKPILSRTDKIGYAAARNTRVLSSALTEFFLFKEGLIKKYGEVDKDENGNELHTISININSPNFKPFTEEFNKIRDVEHEVEIMKLKYDEVIGVLSGREILDLEFMLED